MALIDQKVTDKYAWYNGDTCELLPILPSESIGLSVYSPPFAVNSDTGPGGGALYSYSSSERDMSNARTYKEFFEHYEFVVSEIHRVTLPGRMSCVHAMDVPNSNSGTGDSYTDFPGDIIRLHQKLGFVMASPRITIWKEPLSVRNRTMTKGLAHATIVEDAVDSVVAGADYVLIFRKKGRNPIPVTHKYGLLRYAGERKIPSDLLRYKEWKGNQIENRYSHWIWRQYASCFWDDIRGNTGKRKVSGVLPYREARDSDDERHLHPLQLDVYERLITLWSNRGEKVLEPFGGVGSGVYQAVRCGRLGIGCELKPSYWRQGIKNIDTAELEDESDQMFMEFEDMEVGEQEEEEYSPL